MATFKELVEAVQDNNNINYAQWSDWEDVGSIYDVYGPLNLGTWSMAEEAFLKCLIRDNGENLQAYLDASCAMDYGHVMGGNE